MTEIIAAIAGAFVAGLLAFVTIRWEEISSLFRSNPRSISGRWSGVSYMMQNGFILDGEEISREPDIRYEVTLSQKGSKVTGTLDMTAVVEGRKLYNHSYKGFVRNNYFVYTLDATETQQFRLSTAMLHILNDGERMQGFYVANSGRKDLGDTTVGYAVMTKIG